MTVNTALSQYGTADLPANTAVVDVDVAHAGPKGQTTAQAALVSLGGGGGGGGLTASFITTGAPFVSAEPANASGTITAGGVAQNAFAANAARRGWAVQNQSSEYLYTRSGAAATADQNSVRIAPGQEYIGDFISGGIVSIIGATTGSPFWAREW